MVDARTGAEGVHHRVGIVIGVRSVEGVLEGELVGDAALEDARTDRQMVLGRRREERRQRLVEENIPVARGAKIELAAGVPPCIREAWPIVSGLCRISFCRISFDRPPIRL